MHIKFAIFLWNIANLIIIKANVQFKYFVVYRSPYCNDPVIHERNMKGLHQSIHNLTYF